MMHLEDRDIPYRVCVILHAVSNMGVAAYVALKHAS
jgi:hypothetical protein